MALDPIDRRRLAVEFCRQSGVARAEDALEFMVAGASAVGTALFYDPLVCVRINEGLAEYARGHNLDCLSRLVGTLEIDPDGGQGRGPPDPRSGRMREWRTGTGTAGGRSCHVQRRAVDGFAGNG